MIQKRMDDYITKEQISKTEEIINGKKILVEEGVFWIQKQRQMHSLHYITPYQASFPPQIPAFFIERYSKKAEKVLDPFCGRGTTVFEANNLERIGMGVDISPLAIHISKSKLKSVTYKQVQKRLKEIDFSNHCIEGYEEFKDIYHEKTYSQIINLKNQLKDSPVDNLIKTIILGRLHGHSNAFFSVWTFNVISFSKERIKKQSEKRGLKPQYRDVVPRILKKAKTVLTDPIKEVSKSKVYTSLSTQLPLENDSIDLIVTSPPFLDVINYIDDNWLRFWFLECDREKLRGMLIQTGNLNEYKQFIYRSLHEMNRVLKKGKYCIVEVGDVRHKSKKIYLDRFIVELVENMNFKVEKIMINHMNSPKISKAFRRKKPGQGTLTNRCVILKKL
jgi:DNA modification methylase